VNLLLIAMALQSASQETSLKNCSTRLNRPVARALLSSRTLDQAAAHAKKLRLKTNCTATGKYSGFYSFKPTGGSVESIRGVVAEVLVKDDLHLAAALPAVAIQRHYSRPWFAATGRHVSIDEMATCIADTNPRGILSLLESGAKGAGEAAAFVALEPSFKTCLRAEFKLVGDRQIVRGALADALYQRMVAASALQSGAVH
jgi:hypothetical protein